MNRKFGLLVAIVVAGGSLAWSRRTLDPYACPIQLDPTKRKSDTELGRAIWRLPTLDRKLIVLWLTDERAGRKGGFEAQTVGAAIREIRVRAKVDPRLAARVDSVVWNVSHARKQESNPRRHYTALRDLNE